ncbi:hypothetical protein M413DRAFT_64063 [Hebeloma cylindrosporum]|uniref:HNH nuclease domain-containing protein n=1 Tax=Hebeloma cylindrosporum TaxID=76867 RepID=A0A0C3CTN2_HEBCY|nr:hypothetical protein M413DRAFT_64063 [Hebeloma cylindrosporum h7]
MTSLPPEAPKRLHNIADILAIDKGEEVGNNLIYIRILGYLLHHMPTDRGLRNLIEEINSCAEDSAILDVGNVYYGQFIWAFRANRNPNQTYFDSPLFDTSIDIVNDFSDEAPQSHASATKKVVIQALLRDGYRCVVTKIHDSNSIIKYEIAKAKESFDADPDQKLVFTSAAHIFPDITNSNTGKDEDNEWTMWAVMERFGYDTLPDDLNGSKIHRLENVMTLASDVHHYFDQLSIWFAATPGIPNRYRLESPYPQVLQMYPQHVTFTTPDPDNLPVPSPDYLAIHATCAKVAHLSGAGERIDKFYQEMEDCTTLDSGGASAFMLEHAIFELQARGYDVRTHV